MRICIVIFTQNTSPGVNITQIIASDSDLGPEGELEIGFVANDALDGDHSLFNIDSDTGLITIKENLDRELKETYEVWGEGILYREGSGHLS